MIEPLLTPRDLAWALTPEHKRPASLDELPKRTVDRARRLMSSGAIKARGERLADGRIRWTTVPSAVEAFQRRIRDHGEAPTTSDTPRKPAAQQAPRLRSDDEMKALIGGIRRRVKSKGPVAVAAAARPNSQG